MSSNPTVSVSNTLTRSAHAKRGSRKGSKVRVRVNLKANEVRDRTVKRGDGERTVKRGLVKRPSKGGWKDRQKDVRSWTVKVKGVPERRGLVTGQCG